MRIGLIVAPQRGGPGDQVAQLVADARAAEDDGFASVWVPQVPSAFDALTAVTLMGGATQRIEIGTAVVPVQTRHPVAMAQQALSNQEVCGGRFVLGIGPSHHYIVEDMLGLSYDRPARQVRDYVQVLQAAFAGPGPVDVENDTFRVHNPLDVTDVGPTPILLGALAPVMLGLAGELASGTILWMADERVVSEHVVPRITAAAERAGRPRPRVVAGLPVVVCRSGEEDAVRTWVAEVFARSAVAPNYQRLLGLGDARGLDDICVAGDESAVAARLARYRDAGTTDVALRVLAYGDDDAAREGSERRTRELCIALGRSAMTHSKERGGAMDRFGLEGRVAIVTAASRGLGAEIARTFAGAGAHVVLAARTLAKLEAVRDEIEAAGGAATPVVGDVSTHEGIEEVASAARRLGRVDVLVNMLGGTEGPHHRRVTLREATEADFAGSFAMNVTSHFLMSRAVLDDLAASGHGSIINMGSVAALPHVVPLPHGLYGMSKAALVSLTLQMAQEWAPEVRVNCLLPGNFPTEHTPGPVTTDRPALADRSVLDARSALGRPGQAIEVGTAALFFASDASSFVTGVALDVSGGMGLVSAYD